MISAANKIVIGEGVLLGPNVTVLDHRHRFSNTQKPIGKQKINLNGSVEIGEGSWIGANAVIYGGKKSGIKLGKNCVVAVNTFVDVDVPDFFVV